MAALVDVYPYRFIDSAPEFLILKRAKGKEYSGQWRMVGGKIEGCETAWQCGLRELREETGIFPETYWAVPSLNQFYEPEKDIIHHIPVFAAGLGSNHSVKLDDEHNDYMWIKRNTVSKFIHWPEQQRLITLINTILVDNHILDEWKIPL